MPRTSAFSRTLACRSASKTGSAASRRKWNWQSWCGTPGRARSTARRIEVCPSLTTPSTGTPTASATSRSKGARSSAVAESRLRASSTSPERQSRTTQSTSCPTSGCRPSSARMTPRWPRKYPPQPARVGQAGGEQLVVAVQQVGNAPLGDLQPAPAQGGVDFRHTAVVAVAQHPDQGDNVEAELLLRQRQRALRLRPIGDVKARAARVLAAADPQPQPHPAGQGHHMPAGLVTPPPCAPPPPAGPPGRGPET